MTKWYLKKPENKEFNTFCDKKSFYNKAYVIKNDWHTAGLIIELYSYDTFICAYSVNDKDITFTNGFKDFVINNDGLSKTTLRHIKCFIKFVASKYDNPLFTYENLIKNKKSHRTLSSYFLHLRSFTNIDPNNPVYTID